MAVFYIIPMTDRFITMAASPEVKSQYTWTIHAAHTLSSSYVALLLVLQMIVVIYLQKRAEKK